MDQGKTRIKDGEIVIVDGARKEKVVIRKGTPGALIFIPKDNRFAIGFENSRSKYLIFGVETDLGGKYALKAQHWAKNYGVVSYGDETFYTSSENAYAHLLVDVKKLRQQTVNTRVVKGRKVN